MFLWPVALSFLWQETSSSTLSTLLNLFSLVPFTCNREGTSEAKEIQEGVLLVQNTPINLTDPSAVMQNP